MEKQLELTKEIKCHLDPDIRKGVIEQHKHNEWKPLFGQVGTAQSYLINQAVKKNDIFLFYGRFKKTEGKDNRNLKFVPEDEFPTDRHIIYGYLQVGKKITLNKNKKLSDVPKWMHYHPHLCLNKYKKYKNKQTNTVYIASDTLRAGTFDYDGSLVLTKKSHTISHWDLQKLFQGYLSKDEVKLLRLTKESNDIWKKDEFGENYYVSNRFQERVINIEKEVNIQKKKHILYQVDKWAKDLIKNYAEM